MARVVWRAAWIAASLGLGCGFQSDGLGISDLAPAGSTSAADPEVPDPPPDPSQGDPTDDDPGAPDDDPGASTTGDGAFETTGDATAGSTSDEAPPLDCATDHGGCDLNASCDDASGAVVCSCNPGYVGPGDVCDVDASLATLRIEIPCQSGGSCLSSYCRATSSASATISLEGSPSVEYAVTLRVRGVAEQKTYDGGDTDDYWNEGGDPQDDDWNIYRLDVGDPAATYYLNAGQSYRNYCDAIDYQRTITMRGGSTLTLAMEDDGTCSTRNRDASGDPIVVPGIDPAPEAFAGQFIQIDAIDIQPL